MDPALLMARNLTYMDQYQESKQRIEDSDVTDYVPAFVQDVYHFADLVYAVRNPIFNIPHSMTYGRFKYLLNSWITLMDSPELLVLDPDFDCTSEERAFTLSKASWDLIEPFDNLMVFIIKTPVSELRDLPYAQDTKCSFTDHQLCIPNASRQHFRITYRVYEVSAVTSEASREGFVRMKASECQTIPLRTTFLLTDLMFPLQLIPGVANKAHLYQIAEDCPKFCRY